MIDLKTAAGVARMDVLAAEIGRLVADYHGAISGEHGCGRSRSWFLPQLLGPRLYEAMVAVKDAFDPRPAAQPWRRRGRPRGHRVPALRRRLPRRPRLDAAPLVRRRGRLRPGRREVLRRRPLQEAQRHDVPARRRDARRGSLHAGESQPPAGRRVRRRAARGHRRGRVPRGARHLRRLQGVQDGVPGRRRHGGAQGGVARGGARARGRAAARARHRRLPPPGRPRGAGRSARQPARPHPGGAGRHRQRRRGPRAAAAGVRAPAAHPPAGRRRRGSAPAVAAGAGTGRTAVLFVDCFIQYQEPGIGEALARLLAAAGVRLDAGRRGLLRPHGAVHRPDREGARRGEARAQRPATHLWPPAATCSSSSRRASRWSATTGPGCCPRDPASPRRRPRAGRRWRSWRTWRRRAACTSVPAAAPSSTATATRRRSASPPRRVRRSAASRASRWTTRTPAAAACPASSATRPTTTRSASPWPSAPAAGGARRRPETAVLATGTSCRSQIGDLAGRAAVHPLEFLAGRLQSPDACSGPALRAGARDRVRWSS